MIRNSLQTALAAAIAAILLVGGTAFAKECPALDPVPLSTLIMPPPPDDSGVTIAELQELRDIQTLRTREQAEHAGDDHKRSVERFLSEIGIAIPDKPAKPAGALEFFKCVADAAEKAVGGAKRSFSRTRPYNYPNNGLRILKEIEGDDSPSYPSGHATYGMVVGLLLADMIPEKKAAIVKRIEDFGYSRLVSGVHFRSDVYAGQIAGAVIVATFFKDEKFRDQFDAAKKELRAALGYQ